MAHRYRDLLPDNFSQRALREDVRAGLTSQPKSLPPKWFYDKVGSELYEQITRLPEYYPFDAEREILLARASQIVDRAACTMIVELGSGSSEKTRALIEALLEQTVDEQPLYRAIDVSDTALHAAVDDLARRYPRLELESVRVVFLGGTIGNQTPDQRQALLADLRDALRPGDTFLLGADLVKSPEVLVPAYDDAAGVTAAFNLNVLDVVNARLGATFDRADFRHVAVWDAEQAWIEMRLEARRDVTVQVEDLDLTIDFTEGEQLRTEISAKFTRARLEAEFVDAGFDSAGWWTDEAGRFSVSLWSPA